MVCVSLRAVIVLLLDLREVEEVQAAEAQLEDVAMQQEVKVERVDG